MTRYYVDISSDLLRDLEDSWLPEGWRLIERWGPRTRLMERWLVEDDDAPDDYEGFLVEVYFGSVNGRTEIVDRDKSTSMRI